MTAESDSELDSDLVDSGGEEAGEKGEGKREAEGEGAGRHRHKSIIPCIILDRKPVTDNVSVHYYQNNEFVEICSLRGQGR